MKLSPSTIKKIGIFRALQLGDMLCSVPAIRSLRSAYPESEIVLIGLPWAAGFVKRFDRYVDRFMRFPGYPGLPEQPFISEDYDAFQKVMRDEGFDLILQMQGNGTIVNEMLSTWGSGSVAGFCPEQPGSPLFLKYPEHIHEINRHLKLMEHLGIAIQGTHLEFPISSGDEAELTALGLPVTHGNYVCIHPGSRGSYRQWPPENFAKAAIACHKQGYEIVITGIDGEQEIVSRVKSQLDFAVIDVCGKTSLGAAALLIKNARLIVCNCTGVSHIAAAMGTPGVVISMDGEPERWGPLDTERYKTINWLETSNVELALADVTRLLEGNGLKRKLDYTATDS
jgi:ADP-heptose:LPS heptosyltransferase